MFDQANDQNNQQQGGHNPGAGNDDNNQPNPAASPANHDFNPKPAYDSVFDEEPAGSGSLSSDDAAAAGDNPQVTEPSQSAPAATPVSSDDLINIKKQALEDLSPLVSQLDQDPEEKFHTTMRIIQASDNHSLVKEAYEAARQITDEKVRAQALLDIVNEINYFTKDGDSQPSAENQQ